MEVFEIKTEVVTDNDTNTYRIQLQGEVDLDNSSELRNAVINGIEDNYTNIVIDLTKVTFIDSTTLGILVGITKRLHPIGGNLEIIVGSDNIMKIFELTSLDKILNITRSN